MRYLLLLLLLLPLLPACSPVGSYCQAQADCDEGGLTIDAVGNGDDSVGVCVAQTNGTLRTLRANKEGVCADEADALEKYMACAADVYGKNRRDACEPFRLHVFGISNGNNPCDNELGDLINAQQADGGRCGPDQT